MAFVSHTHTQMQPPCTDQYALHTWITCPPGRICRCRQRLNDLSFFRFLCQWQRLWLCNSAEQAALSAPLLFSPSSVSWPRCFVLAVSDLVASDDGEAGERQTALLLIPPSLRFPVEEGTCALGRRQKWKTEELFSFSPRDCVRLIALKML